MSGSDTLPVQVPSDGIKGLAMMAPVVGLPFLLHAVGGAVITGIGYAAVSSLLSPLATKILQATSSLVSGPSAAGKALPEFLPVPVTVTVAPKVPAGDDGCTSQAEEAIM